jgi:hypothetical protein
MVLVLHKYGHFGMGRLSADKTISYEVEVYESNGKYRHRMIYLPIECSPCFDIGCLERRCIKEIKVEHILENVREMV